MSLNFIWDKITEWLKGLLVGGIVSGVIVITTVYSGVEYFVKNWSCLWN